MDVASCANEASTGELELWGGVTGCEVEDCHDGEFMLGRLRRLG